MGVKSGMKFPKGPGGRWALAAGGWEVRMCWWCGMSPAGWRPAVFRRLPSLLLQLLPWSCSCCCKSCLLPAIRPALPWRADDWKWFNKSVPKVVRELHEQGYQIMIIR